MMLPASNTFTYVPDIRIYRKGIDGLISIVTGTFGLDPTEAGSIFLFCGRKK